MVRYCFLYAFVLLFGLVACTQQPAQTASDYTYATNCHNYTYSKYFSVYRVPAEETEYLRVFNDYEVLHCSPDSTSAITDTLPFNTPLRVHEIITKVAQPAPRHLKAKQTQPTQQLAPPVVWYKVFDQKTKATGYIIKGKLVGRSAVYNNFMVGAEQVGKEGTYIELRGFKGRPARQVADAYRWYPQNPDHRITQLYNPLAPKGLVIKLESSASSCGSINRTQFVVFNGQQFKPLIAGYATGELNEFDYEQIYLPVKLPNGKVMMVANGNRDQLYNWETMTLDTLAIPKNIRIPREQLIVKVKTVRPTPEYYQWTGDTLARLQVQ